MRPFGLAATSRQLAIWPGARPIAKITVNMFIGMPIARMMMGVAGHSLLAYVQLRALAEVLIESGAITREQLEGRFAAMRARELDRTIDGLRARFGQGALKRGL